MNGKITLITPPDFFENLNTSILFCNIDEQQQERISKWFNLSNLNQDLNFYVYTDETDLAWIFNAFNLCNFKYMNLDNANTITKNLASYWLAKNNTYYNITDDNIAAMYSMVNNNRISNIETFLERILIGSDHRSSL